MAILKFEFQIYWLHYYGFSIYKFWQYNDCKSWGAFEFYMNGLFFISTTNMSINGCAELKGPEQFTALWTKPVFQDLKKVLKYRNN